MKITFLKKRSTGEAGHSERGWYGGGGMRDRRHAHHHHGDGRRRGELRVQRGRPTSGGRREALRAGAAGGQAQAARGTTGGALAASTGEGPRPEARNAATGAGGHRSRRGATGEEEEEKPPHTHLRSAREEPAMPRHRPRLPGQTQRQGIPPTFLHQAKLFATYLMLRAGNT